MLTTCSRSGCTTVVFGPGACFEHQPAVVREFARERPFAAPAVAPGLAREEPPARVVLAASVVASGRQ